MDAATTRHLPQTTIPVLLNQWHKHRTLPTCWNKSHSKGTI